MAQNQYPWGCFPDRIASGSTVRRYACYCIVYVEVCFLFVR